MASGPGQHTLDILNFHSGPTAKLLPSTAEHRYFDADYRVGWLVNEKKWVRGGIGADVHDKQSLDGLGIEAANR